MLSRRPGVAARNSMCSRALRFASLTLDYREALQTVWADGAVRCELLSAIKFPEHQGNTGNIFDFGLGLSPTTAEKQSLYQALFPIVLKNRNREIPEDISLPQIGLTFATNGVDLKFSPSSRMNQSDGAAIAIG